MRVISWNMRRARGDSPAWDYFSKLNPDIALLQEVGSIPSGIADTYSTIISRPAITKADEPQHFNTAILVRSLPVEAVELTSPVPWVAAELNRFAGNLVGCRTDFATVVSVHSPAWPVDRARFKSHDVIGIQLTQNPNVWVTELLWASLREADLTTPWIIGGDLNSSETFDTMWGSKPRGNREIRDRMEGLGLTEVLRHAKGELTPTFINTGRSRKVIHQLDHLFVTADLLRNVKTCTVGDADKIFGRNLSDHLPIIADFHVSSSTRESHA